MTDRQKKSYGVLDFLFGVLILTLFLGMGAFTLGWVAKYLVWAFLQGWS